MIDEIKFSEVMARIGKAWLDGADNFFAKLDPNPWQEAHDALEKSLSHGLHEAKIAVVAFEARCLELLAAYRVIVKQRPAPGVPDAFFRGFAGQTPSPGPEDALAASLEAQEAKAREDAVQGLRLFGS